MADLGRYRVTVIDADTNEVLAQSEEVVEFRYLVGDARDVAQEARGVVLARRAAARTTKLKEDKDG